jgi:hypothetical protein
VDAAVAGLIGLKGDAAAGDFAAKGDGVSGGIMIGDGFWILFLGVSGSELVDLGELGVPAGPTDGDELLDPSVPTEGSGVGDFSGDS